MRPKRKARPLYYYLHDPIRGVYLIWNQGMSGLFDGKPSLVEYGIEGTKIPLTFKSRDEALFFLKRWSTVRPLQNSPVDLVVEQYRNYEGYQKRARLRTPKE